MRATSKRSDFQRMPANPIRMRRVFRKRDPRLCRIVGQTIRGVRWRDDAIDLPIDRSRAENVNALVTLIVILRLATLHCFGVIDKNPSVIV